MADTTRREILRAIASAAIILAAAVIWLSGFLHSPIITPQPKREQTTAQIPGRTSTEDEKQRELAEAYWKRYPDVANHHYYGRNGILGIDGAQTHFNQHGKSAGRIYAPLVTADNIEKETRLAEAYWQRYPGIAGSPTWGRKSSLGILCARDHYLNIGQYKGKIWGPLPGAVRSGDLARPR